MYILEIERMLKPVAYSRFSEKLGKSHSAIFCHKGIVL